MLSGSHPDAFTPSIQSLYTISPSVPLTLFPMTLSLPTNQSHQTILKFAATLISGNSYRQLHLCHRQLHLRPHKPETLNHLGSRCHPSPISLIVSSASAIIGSTPLPTNSWFDYSNPSVLFSVRPYTVFDSTADSFILHHIDSTSIVVNSSIGSQIWVFLTTVGFLAGL